MGIFLSTDVLTAIGLGGLERDAARSRPTATWISATNAQYQVTLQNTDSASLAIGIYYLQAYATRAGTPTRTTALLPRGTSLEIIAAASDGASPADLHQRGRTCGRSPHGSTICKCRTQRAGLTTPCATRATGSTR